jgi:hypothetical protein
VVAESLGWRPTPPGGSPTLLLTGINRVAISQGCLVRSSQVPPLRLPHQNCIITGKLQKKNFDGFGSSIVASHSGGTAAHRPAGTIGTPGQCSVHALHASPSARPVGAPEPRLACLMAHVCPGPLSVGPSIPSRLLAALACRALQSGCLPLGLHAAALNCAVSPPPTGMRSSGWSCLTRGAQ